MGKENIGASVYTEFGAENSESSAEDFPSAFQSDTSDDSAASKSPFASSSSSPASPFGAASKSASPFGDTMVGMNENSEPKNLSPSLEAAPVDKAPWWTKITTTQIVLFLSFTTITLSMLATVFVVAKTGAIHFNDDNY